MLFVNYLQVLLVMFAISCISVAIGSDSNELQAKVLARDSWLVKLAWMFKKDPIPEEIPGIGLILFELFFTLIIIGILAIVMPLSFLIGFFVAKKPEINANADIKFCYYKKWPKFFGSYVYPWPILVFACLVYALFVKV